MIVHHGLESACLPYLRILLPGYQPYLLCLLGALALLVAGCSTLPEQAPADLSFFLPPPAQAPLLREVQALQLGGEGRSAFKALFSARAAFAERRRLIREARASLDIQYYLWELDQTGTRLAADLLAAADRGVRVRLLLDDIHSGAEGYDFRLLDAHPQIEVRLFNPFADRRFKLLDFLFDGGRVNHRMHNKLLLADTAQAMIGGRNIGDVYFGVGQEANFRDLDLLLAGEVVPPLALSFDRFWNSRWSQPIRRLEGFDQTQQARQAEAFRVALAAQADGLGPLRTGDRPPADAMDWHPGEAELFLNEPLEEDQQVVGEIEPHLEHLLDQAQRDVLIESAYFIPLDEDIARLQALAGKGLRVRILTNSLATTDVAASYAGYMDSRKRLLEGGVELYELRPDGLAESDELTPVRGSSKASLHSKIILVDRDRLVQGSFNLDPRSLRINTEIGLSIRSPGLTAQVLRFVETGLSLENSYRLLLEDGELVWLAQDGGRPRRFSSEPQVSGWQRLLTWLMSWLPIKQQL